MYSPSAQGVDSSVLDGPDNWLKASPSAGTLYLALPPPQAVPVLRDYFALLSSGRRGPAECRRTSWGEAITLPVSEFGSDRLPPDV